MSVVQNTNGNVYNPDPFLTGPVKLNVPVSKSEKVNASQFISYSPLRCGHLGSTMIVNTRAGPGQADPTPVTVVLPSAEKLLYYLMTTFSAPGVGDYLVTKVYNAGIANVTFTPGTGGSGSSVVAPGTKALVVQWTNVTVGSAAYVILA